MRVIATQSFGPDGRIAGWFVYMMLCADGNRIHVKIGQSRRPFKRLLELHNTNPLDIELMAITQLSDYEIALRLERELHRALQKWRTNGEWFMFAPEDKPQFNQILAIVATKVSPSFRLKWTKVNAQAVVTQAMQRRIAGRRRHRGFSLARKDAMQAGCR